MRGLNQVIGVGSNATGIVYLTQNGSVVGNAEVVVSSAGSGIAVTGATPFVITGLTAGASYTFGMEFGSSSGTSTFTNMSITAQPL